MLELNSTELANLLVSPNEQHVAPSSIDKLGLEDELKGMESAQASHNLVQLQIIASTLESIADDTSVLHIARQRAKRLLAKASSE